MKTYTMQQWAIDGTLNIAVGQQVADDVVAQLRDCVPPACMSSGLFQTGEAVDQDAEHPAWALYDTFRKESDGWVYLGQCLRGHTEPRMGYFELIQKLTR